MATCADCGNDRGVILVGQHGERLCTKCADKLMVEVTKVFNRRLALVAAIVYAVVIWIGIAALVK